MLKFFEMINSSTIIYTFKIIKLISYQFKIHEVFKIINNSTSDRKIFALFEYCVIRKSNDLENIIAIIFGMTRIWESLSQEIN